MPILRTLKLLARKTERFFIYRVMSLDDTPHRLALGVAIAIFIAWTPTMGMQMVLAVALAFLLKANKLVGIPFVWISNPATIFPIYVPNYWIGCKLLGKKPDAWSTITKAIKFNGGLFDRIATWFSVTSDIFWELWLGSLVVGLILGVITYFAMFHMVVVYRDRLHHWQDIHAAGKAKKSAKRQK